MDKQKENERARMAAMDKEERNQFLMREQNHILRLSAKILGHALSFSDDEWPIALGAVNEALDSYEPSKGDFWSYAALVIKSRLLDLGRGKARRAGEMSFSPEVFEGTVEEEDPDFGVQLAVQESLATSQENQLREEIMALSEELDVFGISFFDLAECSPKTAKTREGCAALIRSIFAPPPPLTDKLHKTHTLPVKEMLSRVKISRKIVDRYRKYVICGTLILEGDYPGLSEYISFVKQDLFAEQRR
ncbi:MAG: hypothetical protein IIZ39_08430 [Blautia sp.]|nr:hypothetical protein [Blautia sp.]